jgi:hypothetical protein
VKWLPVGEFGIAEMEGWKHRHSGMGNHFDIFGMEDDGAGPDGRGRR